MTHQPPETHLIDAIDAWNPVEGPLEWPDAKFRELASQVFAHQFEHNAPYRAFCEKRGVTPDTVVHYRDIPAVPTDVFKHVRLTTADEPVRTFRTSGTTVGERGEHHFETLDVYRASLHPPFERFCAPDRDELRMLVIAPSGRDLPDSSLSFMLDELMERYGDADSGFFVRPGEGGGLEMAFAELADALEKAEADGAVTMVLGTAFGFVEFFESTDRSWRLPDGSRLMETGGFKGKSRELSRDELYDMFEARLGVPQVRCVSEYSMTELSSQAYADDLFRSGLTAEGAESAEKDLNKNTSAVDSPARHGGTHRDGVLQTPPWARVEVVDPVSFEAIEAPGEQGLIRWYDLANTDSVLAVQTGDLGVLVEGGGFRLLGRAPEAELRGCSLTIEEIVSVNS